VPEQLGRGGVHRERVAVDHAEAHRGLLLARRDGGEAAAEGVLVGGGSGRGGVRVGRERGGREAVVLQGLGERGGIGGRGEQEEEEQRRERRHG